MFMTVKHRIAAVLILIALAIILIPMWVQDSSHLKIKLWSLPKEPAVPAVPAVQAITSLPEIKIINNTAQLQQEIQKFNLKKQE